MALKKTTTVENPIESAEDLGHPGTDASVLKGKEKEASSEAGVGYGSKSVKEQKAASEKEDATKALKKEIPSKRSSVTTDAKETKDKSKKKGEYQFLNIKSGEKIMFSEHLAIMLDAGIPLREALEVMMGQVSSKNLQKMLKVMIADMSDGFTLSSSLEKFPRVFKPFSVNIIRVGESSGTLPSALHYQSSQLEKAKELQGKIKGAMIYPIIIFVGSIGVACYLALGILPKLKPLFASLNVDLPPTTKFMLASSDFVAKQWPVLLGVTIFLIVGTLLLYRIKPVRFFCHKLILHIPVFGPLVRAIQVAFFARILGILLSSGVQIVQAIGVTAESASNLVYQKELWEVAKRVERGEAITDQLEKYPALFPKITTGMIKVGDRTGRLSESLINAAVFSEKQVDEGTKNLSMMIEPITLILVGGLVGFIALSIITPIYKITEGVSMK